MTLQFYATVTGSRQGAFNGETLSTKLPNKIPGVAFSYAVLEAEGTGTARPRQQPVLFTKLWGASSPQFYEAAYTGEVLSSVLFEFYLPLSDGVESLDHTILLTNATVSLSRQSVHAGQHDGPLIDTRYLHEIAFRFEKIEIVSLTGHTEAHGQW